MLELFHRFLSLYIQSANIVKVESRVKFTWTMPRPRRIYGHEVDKYSQKSESRVKFTWTMPRHRRICERSSNIAKARAEAKFYFDYAEALFGIEIVPNIEY